MIFEARSSIERAQSTTLHLPTTRLSGCVLLVENNDELADAQVALPKSFGLTVDLARTAEQAAGMAEATDSPYDLVLSDIVMPGSMNGVQLAYLLRANKPDLPVILITGYAGMAREATRAGFEC